MKIQQRVVRPEGMHRPPPAVMRRAVAVPLGPGVAWVVVGTLVAMEEATRAVVQARVEARVPAFPISIVSSIRHQAAATSIKTVWIASISS